MGEGVPDQAGVTSTGTDNTGTDNTGADSIGSDGAGSDRAGGPVLQLLATGLQLWVRQQCQAVDSLQIELQGSALKLLRGRLDGVRVLARGVVYRDLRLELVELASDALQVQMGQLWRGQPLQLQQAFRIRGLVSFTPHGLSQSLAQPQWRQLADQLAEELLGIAPLVRLEIRGHRLVFTAQGVGESRPVELETEITASGGTVCIRAVAGAVTVLLPMDPAVHIERAAVEAGMVVLEGTAAVRSG